MRLHIPEAPERYDATNEREFRDGLTRVMPTIVTTDEAVPLVYLLAPDGGVWRVTVDNAGALTTVKVQG